MHHHPSNLRRVVVVVLDGLRADAIDRFRLRCWRRLAEQGAESRQGTTIGPSVTAAAMASLMSGVPPETHGLRSDRFHLPRNREPLHLLPRVLAEAGLPTSGFVRALPVLFRRLGRRIAEHLGLGCFQFSGRTAPEILLAGSERLANQERGLIFLHFPDCDRVGHTHGWMSTEYESAAQRVDLALGMLAACADVDRDPGTLLVALADHGGGGVDPRDHDSGHPLDRTIPVLLAGHAVRGEALDAPSILDVAPTVLWALGLPVPSSYVGRPLVEAFAPAAMAVGEC
jgi:predicted AlkP superfamily pyrophosphatase or phosphodiesterase